jgi:hypothetical protein
MSAFTIWTEVGKKKIVGDIVPTSNGGHASLWMMEILFQCFRPIFREQSTVVMRWRHLGQLSFYEMERRGN